MLEVGAGSGYQTALLAGWLPPWSAWSLSLARRQSATVLRELGYENASIELAARSWAGRSAAPTTR